MGRKNIDAVLENSKYFPSNIPKRNESVYHVRNSIQVLISAYPQLHKVEITQWLSIDDLKM